VIEPLVALPAHVRDRLARALEAGALRAPYSDAAVQAALGGGLARGDLAAVAAALRALADRDIGGAAVALALRAAASAAAAITRPDFVWSGPPVAGLHARDTRQVYDELVSSATRSLWISTYAYFDGPRAFETLAGRMDAVAGLRVVLLLNIHRQPREAESAEDLVARFAARLWRHDWPGERRPDVFYDPRSVADDAPGAVLHAKAVVADDRVAFVTSANLTEAAFDRNIEVGVLTRDAALAATLARHFQVLIDRSLLVPLPSS
jgi:phosphatidylserine/phosphatidylglycerophosphate/cardiolipin synthase-like enzyme